MSVRRALEASTLSKDDVTAFTGAEVLRVIRGGVALQGTVDQLGTFMSLSLKSLSVTALADAATALTLTQASTSQSAVMQSTVVGTSSAVSGGWGIWELPASVSFNAVNWRQIINQNYSASGGVGGEAYANWVIGAGFNWSNTIGIRQDLTKHAHGDIWEYKFNNGGVYGAERHMVLISTAGVSRRWFSAFCPITASTGSSFSLLMDQINFGTYAAAVKIQFNNSNNNASIGDGTTGYHFQFNKNNTPIVKQLNAAADANLNLPYINSDNNLVLSQPFVWSAARSAAVSGLGSVTLQSPSNGDSILALAASGTAVNTLIALSSYTAANNELLVDLYNSGSGNTIFRAMKQTASGDPKMVFSILGATDWALGVDNSDSDKFKISGSDTLGANDYFVIDNSGVVQFGAHTGLGAETVTGYITIKDAAGNSRKLAVVS